MSHARFGLVVSLTLAVVPASHLAAKPTKCDPGRFVPRGAPLIVGAAAGVATGEAIVVGAVPRSRLSISPACDPVRAKVKASRTGTKVKATWRRGACRGIEGKVRLKGRIIENCNVLRGVIKKPKSKPATFTADRATGCGDGLLDVDAGEACETDAGCDGTLQCRQCSCVPRQSEEPTTTSTTTASPTTTTTSTIPAGLGLLSVEAPSALEFGAVQVGGSATGAFTMSNVDPTATNRVTVRLEVDSASFAVSPTQLDLGGGEQAGVTLVFRPQAAGHRTGVVTLVASAANASQLRLLAHGFGGSAPGTGPTLAGEPLFYQSPVAVGGEFPLRGILPSGLRFGADNRLRSCVLPDDEIAGDVCTEDADCIGGRVCPTFSYCVEGERDSLVCTYHAECPGGFCPAENTFEPSDMCGDGTGALFLLNEDSATDPETQEPRGTVARLLFDPSTGIRLAADILYRTQSGTARIACDGRPAGSGGRLYVPEHHDVPDPSPVCGRDEREALVFISKATGAVEVPPGFDDIAEAAGYPECEEFDPVEDIQVARDGSAVFVTLPLNGLSRILPPPPLAIVGDYFDRFEVHPDSSLVIVVPSDQGTTGLLDVYRVPSVESVPGGPAGLTPCATFEFPNAGGETVLGGFAVGRSQPGADDATLLATFATLFTPPALPPLSPALLPRGTVAIDAPAGTTSCSVLGLINLELLSRGTMTF